MNDAIRNFLKPESVSGILLILASIPVLVLVNSLLSDTWPASHV